MRRFLLVTIAMAGLAGILAPPPAEARGRRPPSRKKLLKILKDAEAGIYYLSRDGVTDISVEFPKFVKFGCWIKRLMYWKTGDRLYYEIKDLPPEYQPSQRAFVGKLIDEFDGTMYPLVAKPFTDYAEGFELSLADPANLKAIVFTPKEETRVRFVRQVVEISDGGLPHRVTTVWPPAPPTKEELEIDPDFKGRERETYTNIGYAKVGRKFFFRRVDIEGRERKVIVDIEKWVRRGKHWVPEELVLVDPFAGNEMLAGKDIKLDQGLEDKMFEGFGHQLTR